MRIYFNGSSNVRWTSNLFRNENDEQDDIVFTVQPGFELNVGRGLGAADFSVITSYEILRYDDYSDLDTELFHVVALGSYDSMRWDVRGQVSFDERQTNNGNANLPSGLDDLIESEDTAAKFDAEYRLSPKFTVGSGFAYSHTSYLNFKDAFSDRENWSLPADVYYELTPKVDLSVGYKYGNTDLEGRVDSADRVFEDYDYDTHFFNIGARGMLLPKLSGYFKLGYRYRDSYVRVIDGVSDDQGSSGMFGVDADLTWTVTPKFRASLGLTRDFGSSGEGFSTENTTADLSAVYTINTQWAASSNIAYTLREYDVLNEDDNEYSFSLRANYTPNSHWAFTAGYGYFENDSDRNGLSYENHELSLRATLRY